MNRWIESILTGFAITAFLALLLGNIDKFRDDEMSGPVYKGEINLRIVPRDQASSKLLDHTKQILMARLGEFDLESEISETGPQNLNIKLKGMFGPTELLQSISEPGEISLWELYSIDELEAWKNAVTILFDAPAPPETPVMQDTTASPEIQQMIDSIGKSIHNKKFADYADFPIPEENEEGKLIYPGALINFRYNADTAWFRKTLQSDELRALLPGDAVPYHSEDRPGYMEAYFIVKTRGYERAPLERKDLEEVKAAYDENYNWGLEFMLNEKGTHKLSRILDENPGRPLLAVMDNQAINSILVPHDNRPRMFKVPLGLQTEKTGDLVRLLNAPKFPEPLEIESSSFQRLSTENKPVNPWILLFSFVFFSVLAFFIFKVLKNSPHR